MSTSFLDTTFVGFKRVCSGQMNVMFMTNPENEDLQHPIHVEGLTQEDNILDAAVFIHRADVRWGLLFLFAFVLHSFRANTTVTLFGFIAIAGSFPDHGLSQNRLHL